MMTISHHVKNECIRRMDESITKITSSMELLDAEQIWYRPNDASNSIGNLLLHLNGNITQYILSTLGGKPDERQRSREFSERTKLSGFDLLQKLKTTIADATSLILKLREDQLIQNYSVQCYTETGIGVLIHVTEHLSYHTGQITYITKMVTARDLKFYDTTKLEMKKINK